MKCFLTFTLLLAITASAIAAAPPAQRTTQSANTADLLQLFPDSMIVTRPRFSDEIVGSGPDIVFIPGLRFPASVLGRPCQNPAAALKIRCHPMSIFAGCPAAAHQGH